MQAEPIKELQYFQPGHLDVLLAHGWFRMGRYMYTVNHIGIEREIRVFWLCYQLSEIRLPKSARIIRRNSSQFDFCCVNYASSDELHELYSYYRHSIKLDAAANLDEVLYRQEAGKNLPETFHSRVIEMRHEGRLVGAGIFDHGNAAMMGIVNFFLPEYRKYSPGKMLMLEKLIWGSDNGLKYFYPGYIGASDNRFDYKLFPGESGAYLYDPLRFRWYPYSKGLPEKLEVLQAEAIGSIDEPQWLDPAHTVLAMSRIME